MLKLNETSRRRLKGVHKDLIKVLDRYLEIGTLPIVVTEGLRSLATQKKNVAKGASKTMRSRHLTGHALDIAPTVNGVPSYAWPLYYKLAKEFKQAAKDVGVKVEWGGDWVSFKDGPHWQLPWKLYPIQGALPLFNETEKSVAVKNSTAIATSGVAGAGTLSYDTIGDIGNILLGQQDELSSGDKVRIVLAGIIVAIAIAGVLITWRNYHNRANANWTEE